jgi:phosphomannomutase
MINTHLFEQSILQAYDIRGIVGKNLSETDAYFVGKSFGTFLRRENRKTCIIGYDGRHSSPAYSVQVAKGLRECGIDVINIGLVPTPIVYFGVKYLKKDAGLIITASHNPSEYNGFKMLTSSNSVWGKDIETIGEIAKNGEFIDGDKQGSYEEIDIKKDYLNFIFSILKKGKKTLRVVWDTGNGATGVIINDVIAKLPGEHKALFAEVDGDFPNHHADPSVAKNMEAISKEVVEGSYDFGIAFDGDGDRLGVVDDKGFVLYGDQLLTIFAKDFLRDNPGEKVMTEVKASQVFFDQVEQFNGIPVMGKPGHSNLKTKMLKENIKLAGETSGHMYFGENHNFDDALFAAIKLLNIMSNCDEKLSEIREGFPKTYATREIRVKVGNEKKFEIPEEIAQRLGNSGREFIDVDGVRANVADGWWLVRTSNTEPDLTTRCEALSPSGLEVAKADLQQQLKLSGIELTFN